MRTEGRIEHFISFNISGEEHLVVDESYWPLVRNNNALHLIVLLLVLYNTSKNFCALGYVCPESYFFSAVKIGYSFESFFLLCGSYV